MLRSKVGAGTGVRFTPTLTFVRDTVPDAAHRMEELLAAAQAADADLARIREGKQPVGDPNPYREAPGAEPADDSGDGAHTGD